MKTFIDRSGDTYGLITVISFSHKLNKKLYYNCKCNCGKELKINIEYLRSGNTKSCGCLTLKISNRKSHGRSHTTEYQSWLSIKQRCYNKNNTKDYKDYGGRGITMCDEWRNSFSQFYEDMGDKPSSKHSLDRIDVNGNYSKENCRWATPIEQANNMRTNINLTWNGKTQTVAQWARELGWKKGTFEQRVNAKWSLEDIFNKPVKELVLDKTYEYKGNYLTVPEICKLAEKKDGIVRGRLNLGWSIDDIIKIPSVKLIKDLYYDYENRQISFLEIMELTGLSKTVVKSRLNNGWTIQEILNMPYSFITFEYQGEIKTIKQLAEKFKLPTEVVRSRLNQKWNLEKIRDTPYEGCKTIKSEGIVDSQTERTLPLALNQN